METGGPIVQFFPTAFLVRKRAECCSSRTCPLSQCRRLTTTSLKTSCRTIHATCAEGWRMHAKNAGSRHQYLHLCKSAAWVSELLRSYHSTGLNSVAWPQATSIVQCHEASQQLALESACHHSGSACKKLSQLTPPALPVSLQPGSDVDRMPLLAFLGLTPLRKSSRPVVPRRSTARFCRASALFPFRTPG